MKETKVRKKIMKDNKRKSKLKVVMENGENGKLTHNCKAIIIQ